MLIDVQTFESELQRKERTQIQSSNSIWKSHTNMNLYKMSSSFSLRSLIIYVSIIWLLQIDLASSANSTSAFTNSLLTKPTKLKPNKKALNKSLNKPFRNATLPASLSPAKLTKHLDEETPKTLYQISRDGRHQMLAFGSEITLAYQTQQLVFEEA